MGLQAKPASKTPFYIYPDVAYDMSSVLECHTGWSLDDQGTYERLFEERVCFSLQGLKVA